MREYDAHFPQYGLAQHKGYPTKAHVTAIARHAPPAPRPRAIHHPIFAPLKPKDKSKCKSKSKDEATKNPRQSKPPTVHLREQVRDLFEREGGIVRKSVHFARVGSCRDAVLRRLQVLDELLMKGEESVKPLFQASQKDHLLPVVSRDQRRDVAVLPVFSDRNAATVAIFRLVVL
ncbi:hypothetical protein BBJ28_00025643 [Nothophytophthora sp. Chile5]|nr:hypothetical protein BBJ28_00025643 [Nothophytophthora sp. Chile5]